MKSNFSFIGFRTFNHFFFFFGYLLTSRLYGDTKKLGYKVSLFVRSSKKKVPFNSFQKCIFHSEILSEHEKALKVGLTMKGIHKQNFFINSDPILLYGRVVKLTHIYTTRRQELYRITQCLRSRHLRGLFQKTNYRFEQKLIQRVSPQTKRNEN